MMKCKGKGLRFLLAVFLVMLMASTAYAVSDNRELHTYVKTNTTGAYADTAVSTSTIIPQYHRILGFTMMAKDTTLSTEWVVALYDDASGTVTEADVFDEAEFTETYQKAVRWYKYPKRLTDGLVIRQGANPVVIVYYEDIREF